MGGSAIAGELRVAVTHKGSYDARTHLYSADSMVGRVRDEEIALGIESDRLRLSQAGVGGKAAVAGEGEAAVARHRHDYACFQVHPPDPVTKGIGYRKVSFQPIDRDIVR